LNAALPASAKKTAAGQAEDTAVSGLTVLGPAETYDAIRLSDKINGKAELYLAAGFRKLETRRFALESDPNHFLERYVYDMGHRRGAFAVYSAQRRQNAEPLALAADAYRSANGLFLTHGQFYVEIIAADLSAQLLSRMESLALRFVESHPIGAESPDERRFFPTENKVEHSTALIPANAFGIDRLDWIYTARYRKGSAEATAFISRRANESEAEDLAGAFAAYFVEYGGQMMALPDGQSALKAFTILDSVEIVFTLGPYLGGVHEAGDRDQALALADRLRRNLEEAGREESIQPKHP
jgi:hypothetical protein